MKKAFAVYLTFALFFVLTACTPDDKKKDDTIVTGSALVLTDYSARLTGYVNLSLELGDAEFGVIYDKKESLEDGFKVRVRSLDENNHFTVTISNLLEPGTTYYYKSYIQNGEVTKYGEVKSFTTTKTQLPTEDVVDLGMVIKGEDGISYKLYWAKSNLTSDGLCQNPGLCGDFYAWGELFTKEEYSWSNYLWCDGSSEDITNENITKYNKLNDVVDFSVLDLTDDVAHYVLGGNWRMPTASEWGILRKECTYTRTGLNGYGGTLFTASNGNSIFLTRDEGPVHREFRPDFYWSSSLNLDNPISAKCFSALQVATASTSRCAALQVRPVFYVLI